MQILKGHISPETAYVVADYPYGYTLRCKIRYWLEYKPKQGFRLWSQTTNPKRPGEVWNKPKASTYCLFGGCMFLDENEHVHWSGLSSYSSGAEAAAWRDKYGEGVPEAGRKIMDAWVASKLAYDGEREKCAALVGSRSVDLSLDVGLQEARKAFYDEVK